MWQKAVDIKNGYQMWVLVDKPIRLKLREITNDKKYGDYSDSYFYRSNILNPVEDKNHPYVFVKQEDIELMSEFSEVVMSDTVLIDN